MLYDLTVVNKYSEKIEFVNNPIYSVISITGLNPPNAVINTSTIATTDGAIFNSSRVVTRNIVITIVFHNNIEESRINLYRYFPVKENITLYFSNNSRNVKIVGYVESFECNLFEQGQRAQISIICPQPYFTDENTNAIEFSNIIKLFEFPVNISEEGIEISRKDNDALTNIIYTGDVETGFIIEAYASGNVIEPAIRNNLTNEVFAIATEILAGDKLVINTKRGEKSVILERDGEEINVINNIVQGSKWLTMRPGNNIFSYECLYGAENLNLLFIFDQLYAGV